MASILKKAQQKNQKATKVTNLNALSQQEVIEDKIVPNIIEKKEVDTEQIDLTSIKPEKKVEEEPKQVEVVQQSQETFTWGETKEIDEQEALKAAELQQQAAQQTEKKDDGGKKVVKSWVPQKRGDESNVTATFDEEEMMPELNTENLNKKQEKKAPVIISRAEEPSSSSSNPPRFQNSNKGGFKQLELSEQQKKLLEIEERNKKEYKSATSGPITQAPSDTNGSLFSHSQSSQPPRFMNKKAADGANFVPLQKTDLELKQEEAQKRAEERLKEVKEQKIEISKGLVNPEDSEKREVNNTTEESASKPLRFVNSHKTNQGPNFKPLEVKEVKVPEVLENKKYLTKKEDKPQTNEKKEQRVERKKNQENKNSEDEDSEPEYDENGFKIVKEEKPKKRQYNNDSNKKKKDNKDQKTEQAEEVVQA
ncbi:hypothetical protein TTHERM_00112820 (macronuclear) [Tetrahymena thermophila SB210]|uniref:Uncharacterized protein n=1 Tax=Tetrahymena thermophila (strain SB210) TaxID=312017 RepID=Q22Z89_TETTS|nr:hypothetical protein TTHERM_00112820 [Tetrahymena thermophila SB210]EAR90432.2 hypothetical protein TTHERM_00112820 [Tetrahymena thermophila SB210]|eukprot:XP_001010677.2 hypothetical protein TTHERM_00112820 [Tetrahymena thermophila SB210]